MQMRWIKICMLLLLHSVCGFDYNQEYIGRRFIDELEEIAHNTSPDTNCVVNYPSYGPYGYFNWGAGLGMCNSADWKVGYKNIDGVKAISSLFAFAYL